MTPDKTQTFKTESEQQEFNDFLSELAYMLDNVYASFGTQIQKKIPTAVVYLAKYNEPKEVFEFLDNNNNSLKIEDPLLKIFSKFWLEVLKKDQYLKVSDVYTHDMPELLKNFYLKSNIKAIFCVPLKRLQSCIFIIRVGEKNEWSQGEIDYIDLSTSHIEFFIDNLNRLSNVNQLILEKNEKAQKQQLKRQLTEAIRVTLEPDELKQKIVNEVGKTFDANKCCLRIHLKNKQDTYLGSSRYCYSKSTEGHSPLSDSLEKYIISKLAKDNELCINNKQEVIENFEAYDKELVEIATIFPGKSFYIFSVNYKEDLLATLYIDFKDKTDVFKLKKDKEFIDSILNQIGIAIFQSNLYEIANNRAKQGEIIRKITDTIRQSLDLNKVKRLIVKELGQLFNADRCYIRLYNEETSDFFVVDKYSEYLSDKENTSLVGLVFEEKYNKIINKSYLDKRKYFYIDFTVDTWVEDVIKDFWYNRIGVKNLYVFPLNHQDKFLGFLVIQYSKSKNLLLDEDEIELVNLISTQVSIALQHAQLYSNVKIQNKLEQELRADESILINKNLSKFLGLNSAIIFSVLLKYYNFKKQYDEDYVSLPDHKILKEHTCLSGIEQESAIKNLSENNLIIIQENKLNVLYKIEKDAILKLDKLNNNTKKKTFLKEEKISSAQDLIENYSKICNYSAQMTAYVLSKGLKNKNIRFYKIHDNFFYILFKVIYKYNQDKKENEGKEIQKNYKNDNLIDLNSNEFPLNTRLKNIIKYKLMEISLMATDVPSKLDFYKDFDLSLLN